MPTPKRSFRFPWRSRADIARDVDAELGFHLDMRVRELIAQGHDADTARRMAREEFGDLEGTRAYCRAADARLDRSVRAANYRAPARDINSPNTFGQITQSLSTPTISTARTTEFVLKFCF